MEKEIIISLLSI